MDEDDLRLTVLDVVVVGGVIHWWVSARDVSVQLLNQSVFHIAKINFLESQHSPDSVVLA